MGLVHKEIILTLGLDHPWANTLSNNIGGKTT